MILLPCPPPTLLTTQTPATMFVARHCVPMVDLSQRAPVILPTRRDPPVEVVPPCTPKMTVCLAGPPGPQGAPGAAVTDVYAIAATPLGGHRVVRLAPQGAEYASASGIGVDAVLGITVGAANVGDQVAIRTSGPLTEPSWDWGPGPVYLAEDGRLSQMPPLSGAIREIGVSLNATTLLIRIQTELYLG